MDTKTMKRKISLAIIVLMINSVNIFAQETVSGGFIWSYDIPDTKDTQFQRVTVDFKYELFAEQIGDKYKVWAKYAFLPLLTQITHQAGGTYYYKYHGKWYNSDDMWRVDPRTNDGFMNTYGFVPDVKVTQVSMSGTIIGDKEVSFSAPTSNDYYVNAVDLGYISDMKLFRSVMITAQNTKINYISTSGVSVLHKRIADYEKKLENNKQYDAKIKEADAAFNAKEYSKAATLYQDILNKYRKSDSHAQKQLEEIDRLVEKEKKEKEEKEKEEKEKEEKKKQEQTEQKTQTKTTTSSTETTNDTNDFWNDTSSQTPQKSKEQLAADKARQEADERARQKLDNYLETERTRLKNEQENKLKVLANSYYANEARSRAEQGIADNSSFNQRFENVEDLQNAFYNQANAINQYAEELSDARMQQNANNLDYYWGTSTGTDRAIGEVATGIANIIGQAKAEKERQQAQEKLKKERDAELTRIENERKQKILSLRNDIFKQYPEGGVPLSRHNVNLEELYFFTYSYDGKTYVRVSNVFPYAKYKDGSWAFKDKVKAESEKTIGDKVTLVGYFTTKELAEKERSVFVELLPQAEVNVSYYTVKGAKWDGAESSSTDFWGNETKTKQETKTSQQKTEDFWGEGKKTEKKTETKKDDSFWD